jgi:hypothetical protein
MSGIDDLPEKKWAKGPNLIPRIERGPRDDDSITL